MSRACLARLPSTWKTPHGGGMEEDRIPPELLEELRADAKRAAKEAPPLTDEQIRALRLALRPEPEANEAPPT